MSWDLDTLTEGVTLRSVAFNGKYHISARKKGEEGLPKGEWNYVHYCSFLKELWQKYLNNKEQPEILGYKLPISELAAETIHLLTPMDFLTKKQPLPEDREALMYWLLNQKNELETRIPNRDFIRLKKDLEDMIKSNIEIKKGK